jgi:hypothetical protein
MGRLLLALIASTAIAAPLAGPLSGTASATWYDNGIASSESQAERAMIPVYIALGSPAVPLVRCNVLAELEYAGTKAQIIGLRSTRCTEPGGPYNGGHPFELLGPTMLTDEGPRNKGERGQTTLPWPVTVESLEPPRLKLIVKNMELFLVAPNYSAQSETPIFGTLEVALTNGFGNGFTPTTISQGQYFIGGMDFKEVNGSVRGTFDSELVQWR